MPFSYPDKPTQASLLRAAESYGLPLYAYDLTTIRNQYQRFVQAFNTPKLRIHYAMKALSNFTILQHMRTLGLRIDAVSIGEVLKARAAGFHPDDILFTPSGVSPHEYELAISEKVRINIDNLDALEYFGVHHPHTPVGIRINPHVMGGGHSKISVGHIDSKFGISIHQLPLVHRLVQSLNMRIAGIHMHTGSDILDTQVFLRASDILFDVARQFEDLQYLDFGSGFKVAYHPNDIETNIEELGKYFTQKFEHFCASYGKELELIFEPGKFLVSQAGYFLARVNWIKQTTSTRFALIDSGFNHFIRPMFYGAHHEIINLSNPDGKPRVYTIAGYICETDTFAANRLLPEIRPGDILCFLNAGAYGYVMASHYNTRPRPAEVLIHQDTIRLINPAESWQDLWHREMHNRDNPS